MATKLSPTDQKEIELAHLGLDFSEIDFSKLKDPFSRYYSIENYVELLKIIRDPQNFSFTCKYIFNVEPTVFQLVWLEQLWKYPFPMIIAGRGASKSFTTALYHALRATITQGSKTVIASASFRQSKLVFDYIENIWNNAPVWRDLCGNNSGPSHQADMYTFKIGKSSIVAVPTGDGQKLRGLRATNVHLEEFNSLNKEIVETVLRGFTATSSSPVENIKTNAKLKKLTEKGLLTPELEAEIKGLYKPNQIIITGTAGWGFQVFSEYYEKYRKIIKSGGNADRIKDILGNRPDKGFDHRDYCIIRMPAELLPEGLMDAKALANAKATMDEASYQREFGAIFVKDSNGFFPRSLIESCTCKEPIRIGTNDVKFGARIRGDAAGRYIMAVDPASESDNLAIVILENLPDHNRVVYCWTIKRSELIKRVREKSTQENSFYSFIARKIRDLMKIFPIEYIALDSQGGGIAVMEALHDLKKLEPGEVPIWPLRDDDPIKFKGFKDYGYDDEHGLHIIEMVNASSAEYTLEANHGMKKDMQNKMLLFPYTDAVTLMTAQMHDSAAERYDTLEDVVLEIEELKNELSTIQHTTTLNGRDRFTTPEGLTAEGKKIALRKDRYSALLYANALARRLFRQSTIDYSCRAVGGFTEQFRGQEVGGAMYVGSDDFVKWANQSILGVGVSRSQNGNPFGYYQQASPSYHR